MKKYLPLLPLVGLLAGCTTARVGQDRYRLVTVSDASQFGRGAQFIVKWQGTNKNDYKIVSEPVFHSGWVPVLKAGIQGSLAGHFIGEGIDDADWGDDVNISNGDAAPPAKPSKPIKPPKRPSKKKNR